MFKRLSLYTLLLCFVPFFLWGFAYHWNGNEQLQSFDHALYWLTETGSVPYALITCVVFAGLFYFLFNSPKQWLFGVMIMAFSVIVTQGLKTGLKAFFAEPRPFTVYLAEQTHTSTDQFYQHERSERAKLVQDFYTSQPNTPVWLEQHYETETGYSFPSGHTIFAATWVMLAVGFSQLLGRKCIRAKLLVGGLTLWAILMMISRVRLGMHYPIDLFISLITAWLVHLAIFGFLAKKVGNVSADFHKN